jgi:sec-independent protein translocase protein TatC
MHMATNRLDEQDPFEAFFAGGEDDENEPSAMSLVEHLEELRWRIFKSLLAITIGTVIAFIFRGYIVHFLELPLPQTADSLTHGKPIVTGITEGFTVFLLISIAAGFILALPVVLYQTWAFIAPGLLEKEKKHAVPFILAGIVLFIIGVTVGYIVLRYPVEWLVTFAADSFAEFVTAGSYFTFVAFFILAFGIVFQLPLVLTFMAQIDLISSQTLIKKRAASHVGMWIASTFLTPGADIYSPIFLGVSMSFLYELSIIFIKITKK